MKSISGKETIQKEIPDILYDESRFTLGVPERVYYPENTADISEVIQTAHTDNKAVTLIGAQTGITGGSVPSEGCYAICFNHMQKILRVETGDDTAPILFCQPGVTLADINEFLNNPAQYKYNVTGCEILNNRQWFYPPDPTEQTAHLGGTVATNASGARSYKFGSTRDHIVTLSLVLASGETVSVTRNRDKFHNGFCTLETDQGTSLSIPQMDYQSPGIKNASGYFSASEMDIIDLFIGSEGTLAVFSEIGVRLSTVGKIIGGLSFFLTREGALNFSKFLHTQDSVTAIEYFDSTALDFITNRKEEAALHIPEFPQNSRTALYWEFIENSGVTFEDCMDEWEIVLNDCGSSFDATWSGFDTGEMERLKSFRHAVPELINLTIAHYKKEYPSIRKVSTDGALPHNTFEIFFQNSIKIINENNLKAVIFGHLGDYHLHINILPQTKTEFDKATGVYERIMEIIISHGGTISAEHGIGKFKVPYFKKAHSEKMINEMKKIKSIFDPEGILNPGNLFG